MVQGLRNRRAGSRVRRFIALCSSVAVTSDNRLRLGLRMLLFTLKSRRKMANSSRKAGYINGDSLGIGVGRRRRDAIDDAPMPRNVVCEVSVEISQ